MNDAAFELNIEIIARRWPQLITELEKVDPQKIKIERQLHTLVVDNIQLSSNYEPLVEAKLQCQQIDENATIAHVYGTGIGAVQQILLQRAAIKELNVCILNFTIFYYSLALFDHSDWLADPRTNLYSFNACKQVLVPFVALPAELVLAQDDAAQLRDRLELELANKFIHKKHHKDNDKIKQLLLANERFLVEDEDILSFEPLTYTRVIIAAAGPTLAQHYHWLKQRVDADALLIALDASVKPLLDHGIVPDVVVSIDPYSDKLFANVDLALLANSSLVYFPRLKPAFLSSWPGKRFAAYSVGELYDDINQKHPKTRLFSGGSVIHPAIDFAVKLGFDRVILLGADFCFPFGKSHAHWQDWQQAIEKPQHWLLNGYGEKVATMANFKGYMRDLEQYIAGHSRVHFYNGSVDGAQIEGTLPWNKP